MKQKQIDHGIVKKSQIGNLERLAAIDDDEDELESSYNVPVTNRDGEQDFEDMILMDRLTEMAILENLSNRYRKDKIYTFIGSVLVAMNPLRELPIYGQEVSNRYKPGLLFSNAQIPAHIYAVSAKSVGDIIQAGRSQCILVNGESGAGKTESAKFVLRQIVECGGGGGATLERRIIDADPILEAFGNARTIRNHNSSRFGKFVDLNVSRHGQGVRSGRIEHFLLERSRVVKQAEGERGFHVFYQLLAGLDHEGRSSRQLSACPLDYNYTQRVSTTDESDLIDFQQVYSSLAVLAFSPEDIAALWSLLAAILHLGNIEFRDLNPDDAEDAMCAPTALAHSHAEVVAKLLGLTTSSLIGSLIFKKRQTRNETLVSPVETDAAHGARDALAKAIYGRLFDWLVGKINSAVQRETKDELRPGIEAKIGILDIFGFENMQRNSFEQLCINFANEVLHQYFLNQLFKVEQAEYAREGIDWTPIDFEDNQSIIDLLAGPNVSVMALLDDVARLSAGSDDALVRLLHAARCNDPSYGRPQADVDFRFMVRHFAGKVIYAADGMVEKNRDDLSLSLLHLIEESKNSHLRTLFEGESARRRRPTLVNQFRHSVDALMTRIRSREAHFVRCVKPNEAMIPGDLDLDLCMRQLRYLGVKDTVRVRRSGYAVRYPMEEFVKIYSCLMPSTAPHPSSHQELCHTICKSIPKENWALGNTKVFLRLPGDNILQRRRAEYITPRVIRLQARWRGLKARRRYQQLRTAAIHVQAAFRMWVEQRRYQTIRQGILRLQALARMRVLVQHRQMGTTPAPPSKLVPELATEYLVHDAQPKETTINYITQGPMQLEFTFRNARHGPCHWKIRMPEQLPPPQKTFAHRAMVEFRVDATPPASLTPSPMSSQRRKNGRVVTTANVGQLATLTCRC